VTDHVTTQTAVLATLPDGTQIAVDQLPTGELVQIVKLYDGAADSINAASVSAAGALKVDPSAIARGRVQSTGGADPPCVYQDS
jgi:hypothetical protein